MQVCVIKYPCNLSSKYIISDHQAPHFITFSTVEWVDALSRPEYKNIIIESLKYCQNSKGLVLYAYVIMNNHVHLICAAKEGFNLSEILRDLKKYTSKKLLKYIKENDRESRRKWMMWLFESAGKRNSNNSKYQFWQQDNRPIELSTVKMVDQRLNYIHQNPVKEGIVYEPEYYVYSSAIDYAGGNGLIRVNFLY